MSIFKFKEFEVKHSDSAMKVGTDGVLLGAWANSQNPSKILDIGTGCGVIALMLAQRYEQADVVGVEIDEAAASEASYNASQSPFKERVAIENRSVQEFSNKTESSFDLIVCNPPFFTGGTMTEYLDREVARHTTRLSHYDLLRAAQKLISKTGVFTVVLPYLEGHQFLSLSKNYGFYPCQITEVRPKKDKKIERLLIALSLSETEVIEEELIIQFEKRNDYTEAYMKLTQAFYLNM